MSHKPVLCLDFDGVIHNRLGPWAGIGIFTGDEVPGAVKFIVRMSPHFQIAIYSSHSCEEMGIEGMKNWLFPRIRTFCAENSPLGELVCANLVWPTFKPPANVTIDDRALTFTGIWPSLPALLNFKPWNEAQKTEEARLRLVR